MVFTGSKESCPNYDTDTNELNMSWDTYTSPFQGARSNLIDPSSGKTDFNKKCFNICPTLNDDLSDKGPTYIDNGLCLVCSDEEGSLNNPAQGTRRNLKDAGRYEMCNVADDPESGSNNVSGSGLWFQRQQDANLSRVSDGDGSDGSGSGSGGDDGGDISSTTNTVNNLSSFTSLLSGLQYDSTFEACVNDKLNTGVNDLDAQERVSKYTSIKEFKSEDINYLKQKLRKISIMKTDQVNECMNLLNLGKSLCQTGVADKTLMIGSLIFKIIGNDKIDIMKADNDEKYKINQLVDEIGPLIPRAVKNIIKVSKEYEARVCNVPSNTTLLLERLYTDLYDKQTNVTLDISPYIDFDSLIGEKDIFTFIKKITVLVVFAFLFMQATNLVVAFLSRGSSATGIN